MSRWVLGVGIALLLHATSANLFARMPIERLQREIQARMVYDYQV